MCIMKSEEDSHHSHRGQRNEEGKVENCTHIKRCVFYLSPMLGNVGSGGIKIGKSHFKGEEKPS